MELQVSVQSLLNDDEKEADHTDWYEPKLINFRAFLDQNPRQSQMIKFETKESSMSSALVSLDTESHTGAGFKECIIPVKLDKGTKTVQTCFSRSSSSAKFCTEALMTQLNATGKKVEILLKTTGQERPVTSYKFSS